MGLIVCGWCGHQTDDRAACDRCGHAGPRVPYEQRGLTVPGPAEVRRRKLREAEAALRADGVEPTAERLAERLNVDARTVRRWQKVSA